MNWSYISSDSSEDDKMYVVEQIMGKRVLKNNKVSIQNISKKHIKK